MRINTARYLFLNLFLLLFFSKAYSADIIIKYIVEKDSSIRSTHSVSDYLLGIVENNYDNIEQNAQKNVPSVKKILFNSANEEIVLIKYKINRYGTFFITDFYGHEVLLDPSITHDTIVLNVNLNRFKKQSGAKKNLLYLNDSVSSTKFYIIKYPPKYKYMGFFDTLAYLHGDLHSGGGHYSFKEMNHQLDKYLSKVNAVYFDRVKFYKSFISQTRMPAKLKYYALKEIQYSYYNDLLDPLLNWDASLLGSYPDALRDTIKKIGRGLNNKDLFENIAAYRGVVFSYVYSGLITPPSRSFREKPDSAYLLNRSDYAVRNLRGYSQGYLLASLMRLATQINSVNTFELLYREYDHGSSLAGVNRYTDSLRTLILKSGNLAPTEVLNLNFETAQGENLKLQTLLNKDLIVVDCWATWCIPCRKQEPFLWEIATKYKDRVQFISISADQLKSKWDHWLLGNNSNGLLQLHAAGGFENVFFKRLMINAIPRYILLSRSGQLLNLAMPYPQDKDAFEKELQQHLN
ncbi:TlpA family protein disulfide reductase [Mucilaginibacter gossypii]|uniref:Thiol-disulfide isomerase or thioredoxin n=2 Tax=Mucilaginibacter TaxID=423349 RepID=A0A1G8EXR4_9SPHI|nr:TlpA disulfide reductase family protein [Mucilaginibacter gossypii]SDH74665.1 Thiol-disulfide isomerase or thioredoxin [Mucilaginibacter gossypii]